MFTSSGPRTVVGTTVKYCFSRSVQLVDRLGQKRLVGSDIISFLVTRRLSFCGARFPVCSSKRSTSIFRAFITVLCHSKYSSSSKIFLLSSLFSCATGEKWAQQRGVEASSSRFRTSSVCSCTSHLNLQRCANWSRYLVVRRLHNICASTSRIISPIQLPPPRCLPNADPLSLPRTPSTVPERVFQVWRIYHYLRSRFFVRRAYIIRLHDWSNHRYSVLGKAELTAFDGKRYNGWRLENCVRFLFQGPFSY